MNILVRLIGLMLIPAVLAAGGDREPTREPVRNAARSHPRANWVPTKPGPWHSTIRTARSTDGLRFEPDEGVAIHFANAPAVMKLPDGRLLLVYEYFSRTKRRDFGRLGFSLSKDSGKAWSPSKPLEIRRLSRRVGRPRGPVFVKTSNGPSELYFVCDDPKGRQTIFAAKLSADGTADKKNTKDEIVFEIRDKVRLKDKKTKLDGLVLVDIAGTLHVYATPQDKPNGMYHGTFSTPTRIDRKGLFGLADLGRPGAIIKVDGAWRLYATAVDGMHRLETGATGGIVSATSADGYDWSREDGSRLKAAADPAVVRLADNAYLMLYVEPMRPPQRDHQLSTEGAEPPPAEQGPDFETWYTSIEEQAPAEADTVASKDSETADTLDAALEGADAVAQEDAEIPGAEFADGLASEGDDVATENVAEPSYCFGDVPIPDFKHYVDYLDWMEQRHDTAGIVENAYDYYEAFMPMPGDEPGDKPEWPIFSSMFHDVDRVGPPGPWDPADHPDWEATFLASADLEAKYAQAASIPDYVTPILMSKPTLPEGVRDHDSEYLLLNIMLPTLSKHRAIFKQTLGDAWRAPGGKPDPQRMLDTLETTLSSTEQRANGDFLIETLVSAAEKNMVEDTALRALQHEVFSADQMESALEILIERNRSLPDPAESLKGEVMWAMDYCQYVYGPIEPNRKPTLNPARMAYVSNMASEGSGTGLTEEQIAAADPHKTVETFVNYYQTLSDMMRRGYPEVRAADLEALQEAAVAEDDVARPMLPALSRYYQLAYRSEASRRATQLTYAIHLYEARHGQWPKSLDDLPPRYTQGVRTDPFSGGDFVYRMTDNGPVLYSTSENGLDDGGSHHRRWGDDKAGDEEGDDHVFWPPQ